MRILVTGAGGFVGSHLVDILLSEGHDVIGVDNYYTGQRENLLQAFTHPNFKFIQHDIVDPSLDFKVSGMGNIDQIYHLACPASPVAYQLEPVRTIKTNVIGTMNMLDLAKKYDATILIASTSEVYGDPLEHPQREEYWGNVNPIGHRACYDEGKRCAETLAFEYYRCYDVKIRVARIFNTYGPRMSENDGRVVSNFIVQALKSNGITVFGDGSQTRSFCYVTDTVAGLMKLMNSVHVGPINIGNPSEFTVLELAEKVSHMVNGTNIPANIEFRPLPSDDPTKRKPDITKAKELLKWQPVVSVDVGLEKTINYFRTHLKTKKPDN